MQVIISLNLTVVSVSLIVSGIESGKAAERIAPGDFNISEFFIHLAILNLLIYVITISWYANSVSVGPIVAETWCPRMCSIFKRWDRMNTKLIPEQSDMGIIGRQTSALFLASSAVKTPLDRNEL